MTPVDVRVALTDDADPAVPLPAYATAGAAGADLRANQPAELRAVGLTLQPGDRVLVPTGLRIALPAGFEAQIRPRSGLALKHGLTLPNSPGTIDEDYRGPLGVIVQNGGSAPYTIAHADRIAQMVIAPVVRARIALSDRFDDTPRGAGGFGSTGGY